MALRCSSSVLVALALACGAPESPANHDEPAASEVNPPSPASKSTPVDPGPPLVAPPEPARPGPALPAAPVFVAGAFELREGASKKLARPTAIFPRKREPEDMRDHAWAFGWTEDGSAFVYCIVISGAECDVCTFTGLTGATEKFQSGEECQPDGGTLVTKGRLKARVAARKVAVRDGDWAHGGDLVVTLREVFGSADGKTRGALEVGTARRDGSAASTAHDTVSCIEESDGPRCLQDAHADVIAPSPDGASVAVLGHMWEGESSDEFSLAIVPAGRLAAATYNQEGLDALRRTDHAAAATAFLAAMHADAAAWKGPYNLACAYAAAADLRAQAALEAALRRDGDAVRKRAATDTDLDGVRSQAWFTALIGPAR